MIRQMPSMIGMPATCELCSEGLEEPGDIEYINGGQAWAHRECLLRCGIGGIGHLQDHDYWCTEKGDPDGGRSLRQSALEVDHMVALYGVEYVVQLSLKSEAQ